MGPPPRYRALAVTTPPPAPTPPTEGPPRRVLRISHSSVVAAWRRREEALRRQGLEVELVTAMRWNEGGSEVALEPAPGEAVVGARTLGRHPCGFVYDPRPLWRALRQRPDLLDLHEEPYSLAAAEVVLLARLAGARAPLVVYSAQNLNKRYPWPVRLLERLVQRRAAGAYVCNDGARTVLAEKGFTGLVDVVPLGVEVESQAAAGPPQRDRFTIGFTGRLEVRKGILVLVDAVAAQEGWRLRIAGEGPDRDVLERHLVDAAPRATVELVGHLQGRDLASFYGSLDVLAVPSLPTEGWVEQFGRSAVEAMASGVPVVASETGALPEVLAGAGLLVPPGDAVALGRVLEALANDPARRDELSRRARRQIQRFSWDEVAARQAALYRAVSPA